TSLGLLHLDIAYHERATVLIDLGWPCRDHERVRRLRAWLGAVVHVDLEVLIRNPIDRGLADDQSMRIRSARAGADHERGEGGRRDVGAGHEVSVAHVARRARIPAIKLHGRVEGGSGYRSDPEQRVRDVLGRFYEA